MDFTTRVLVAVAAADAREALVWRSKSEDSPGIEFLVDVTDTFTWVDQPDLELVTEDNVAGLELAVSEVLAATGGDGTYALALFVARGRKIRPQTAAWPSDVRVWPLFEAAGPETAVVDEVADVPSFDLSPVEPLTDDLADAATDPDLDEPERVSEVDGPDRCGLCGQDLPTVTTIVLKAAA